MPRRSAPNLESPEQALSDITTAAESPRGVSSGGNRRNAAAKSGFALHHVGRSASAERAAQGTPGAVQDDAWNDLEAGKLQASVERREEIGECQRYVNGVPLLNRRLSMGDSRVDESVSFERKMSWDEFVRLYLPSS